MSIADFREMTEVELFDALVEAKEERFNLRFQVATNQLDNTARLKTVKKEIAQILTILRERELAAASAGADEVGVPVGTPAADDKGSA
ncbi:MAG: 50S ribosomal protein L29 [Acidimicrobiia bacterium]|jgi:large subunit ribosomal protein L29